ncbi:hypothetical protein [Burkholderia lata]|uniref:Uncharacterized protein n=1 Tax=Burkholderia lata (strain ATCC 17760 / DSM 23089 / LMG 22485 / NCIMB 9086 / R18194 / 383) TaxID=482957 RepID=Q39G32_BURL3|nr:hypothetical protein [Burkholderia lata]ABB08584.1 hypothetical protein Bcep18194_A4990 [Burkholderia lata]
MSDDYSALRAAMHNSVTFLDKNRPFPVSPTPLLIPEREYDEICRDARQVLVALEKAIGIVSSDGSLWRHFPELHGLEDLVRFPGSTSRLIDLARFDLAIVKGGGVRMMETNAGCPGALTTVGDINQAFRASAFFNAHIAGTHVPLTVDNKFYFVDYLASLVDRGAPLNMAFISSKHRRIVTDLDRLTELAQERGYGAIRCDVQDLDYDGRQLTHKGTPVTVAYLKFDAVVTEAGDMDLGIYGPEAVRQPFLEAVRDGAFKYVNSFASQLLAENKRMLAMLHTERVQRHLSSPEVDAIKRLVARTWSLSADGLQQFGGRERLLHEKNQCVLKQVIESRGRGVHIGRHTSDAEWRELVASPTLDRYIVQEWVELDRQEVLNPVFDDPGRFAAYTDMGLYMVGGEPAGFLCRASHDPVVNVGKSGALRPTFVTNGSPRRTSISETTRMDSGGGTHSERDLGGEPT